jgi:hypothetical protein
MSIKMSRTARLCDLARYPQSYADMLARIPRSVVDHLPARLLAELIESNWQLCEHTKHLARVE